MKAANKDGWIRHRGGKCPVEKGVRVDVRYRDGEVFENQRFSEHDDPLWGHDRSSGDIMAYRLHKPAEHQPETMSKIADECAVLAGLANNLEQAGESLRKCEGRNCKISDVGEHSKECLLDTAIDQGWAGPLQWRDRITTIDFDIHSLTNEREELVQKLASEGLQLLDVEKPVAHPAEDMRDWRNWREGDLIECIYDTGSSGIKVGVIYCLTGVYYDYFNFSDDDGHTRTRADDCNFKFHSRPTK